MASRIFSILAYILAGFLHYTATLIGFAQVESWGAKLGIVALFEGLAAVPLVIGLGLDGFHHVRRDIGVVLLSSAGLSAFIIITFASMLTTSEFREMLGPEQIEFFSAHGFGFGGLALTILVGSALVWWPRRPTMAAASQ